MSEATVLEGLGKVPPFPPVAVRLLALLANPIVEIREVAELIASDATFTARLLRLVNSCEFALTCSVNNVQQAISLLGVERTRQVVVSHATAKYALGPLRSAELRRCWQHTVATAVLADYIANCAEAFTDIAFTAGIIHDIGRLGLLLQYPRQYEQIISTAAERCLDLLDFEREEFGMDHAEAGRLLVNRWNLSPELAMVAGRHHDACEGAELDLIRIIHVACRLADALGYEVARPLLQLEVETILRELPSRVRARTKLSPAELCSRIEKRILEYDSDNIEPATAASEDDEAKVDDPPNVAVEPIPTAAGEHWTSFVVFFISAAVLGLVAVLVLVIFKLN
jgi:HD-like signal output (HDOD) protein